MLNNIFSHFNQSKQQAVLISSLHLSLISSLYLCICFSDTLFSFVFTSWLSLLQPVEIPFSLISSDRAGGTPGGPVQLAGLWAESGSCPAPGRRFSLPRNLKSLEHCVLRWRSLSGSFFFFLKTHFEFHQP